MLINQINKIIMQPCELLLRITTLSEAKWLVLDSVRYSSIDGPVSCIPNLRIFHDISLNVPNRIHIVSVKSQSN